MMIEVPISSLVFDTNPNEHSLKLRRISHNSNLIENSNSIEKILSKNEYLIGLSSMLYYISSYSLQINLPSKLSEKDFLSSPLLGVLLKVFFDVRMLLSEKEEVYKVFIKGLTPEAKQVFEKLKNEKKIDDDFESFFGNITLIPGNNNLKCYKLTNSNSYSQLTQFHKFLLIECHLNNGFLGLPISPLTFSELENDNKIRNIPKLFSDVFFVGSGEQWRSTHIILKNPLVQINVDSFLSPPAV